MCREFVERILETAAASEEFRMNLFERPAAVMREAGFPVEIKTDREFDTLFKSEVFPLMRTFLQASNGTSFMSVQGAVCAACKIAAWLVGTAVVGAVAVAVLHLPVAHPAVVGLAGYMGISATQAAAFIGASAGAAAGDVRAFVAEICTYINVCP